MKRRLRTILLIVAVALVATSSAVAAMQALRVIGRGSSSGDFATVIASGTAKRPAVLYARVTSRPRQRVTGNWTIVCSKGLGAGSKSGSFAGRTPIQKRLRFPMRRPDSCTVSAGASLDRSGRIVVTILKG